MSDLSAQAIEAALGDSPFGRPVFFFPVIGSTNDQAKRLADSGAAEGTLVVADEQSAGRGRAGRGWHTSPGVALALSVILRPLLANLGRITMLGGLAAAEAIDALTDLPTALKWPNDVWVNSKKVAGVLAESAMLGSIAAYVVLGIGVNVNGGPPEGPAYAYPVTYLAAEARRPIGRLALLAAIVRRVSERYLEIGQQSLQPAWAARLQWRGERVAVDGLVGVAEGVEADGALRIRLDTGEVRAVISGDVHLRPV